MRIDMCLPTGLVSQQFCWRGSYKQDAQSIDERRSICLLMSLKVARWEMQFKWTDESPNLQVMHEVIPNGAVVWINNRCILLGDNYGQFRVWIKKTKNVSTGWMSEPFRKKIQFIHGQNATTTAGANWFCQSLVNVFRWPNWIHWFSLGTTQWNLATLRIHLVCVGFALLGDSLLREMHFFGYEWTWSEDLFHSSAMTMIRKIRHHEANR